MPYRSSQPPKTTTAKGLGWTHQKARARLLNRHVDGTRCAWCGKPMFKDAARNHDRRALHADHEQPRSRGGTTATRLLHGSCNEARGAGDHRRTTTPVDLDDDYTDPSSGASSCHGRNRARADHGAQPWRTMVTIPAPTVATTVTIPELAAAPHHPREHCAPSTRTRDRGGTDPATDGHSRPPPKLLEGACPDPHGGQEVFFSRAGDFRATPGAGRAPIGAGRGVRGIRRVAYQRVWVVRGVGAGWGAPRARTFYQAQAAAARISSSSTAVYRSVVAIDACPSRVCTARRLRVPR